jgi:hypothetical protein
VNRAHLDTRTTPATYKVVKFFFSLTTIPPNRPPRSEPDSAKTPTIHARMEGQPVDGFLGYASVVNMKVGGTLGNEGSIWVRSTPPAVVKSAPAAGPDGRTPVPVGLLQLDGHAHRTVLKYLEPTWVHRVVGGRKGGGGEIGGGGSRPSRFCMILVLSFDLLTQGNP